MTETTADRVLAALQPYELRKEGQNEYRLNSPLRPGSNSHAFKLRIADGEHGSYYDHARNESGSLYQLADALGIPVNRTTVETTKRAYRDLAEYAAAHGVTADVLKAAGWSDREMVHDFGMKQDRPALAFQTAGGKRYRFIDGEAGQAPYKSEKGYKACWYGLKRAVALARESGAPLVLCNGEASTIVAQHYGLPAACVTSGEKKYPNELVQELLTAWDGDVWIALDCDDTGRKAARDIAAQLVGRAVTVIDLGLTAGGDLGDFCKLYTTTAPAELGKLAITPPKDDAAPASDMALLATALDGLRGAIRADDKAKAAGDVETLLAGAQAEIDRIAMHISKPKVLSFEDIAAKNLLDLKWSMQNPSAIQGLRSKIGSLDKAVGGFSPEMYVIYGATNMGKSTLAVSIAREFVQQAPGFIASTESDPHRWMTKLVASLTSIPSDKIEGGMISQQDHRRIKDMYDWLATMKCHFLASGSPTVSMIRAPLLDGVAAFGYEWFIVDSASRMRHPGANSIYDITYNVANGLQALWQEANIPLITTSQVGRDVAERGAGQKMPQLEDGYGGGIIEHNAGVVMGLYNHNYYVERGTEPKDDRFPLNTALVRMLKNRWHGGSQVNAVWLKFVGGAGFYELDTHTTELKDLA
jgi:replicative DNA helicase